MTGHEENKIALWMGRELNTKTSKHLRSKVHNHEGLQSKTEFWKPQQCQTKSLEQASRGQPFHGGHGNYTVQPTGQRELRSKMTKKIGFGRLLYCQCMDRR